MTPPRSAFGASPPGGHRWRTGRAGSAAAAWLGLALSASAVQASVIDDFRDAGRWKAAASDQVRAELRSDGDALCLDYDFAGVSGYAFVRRELPLELPPHYAFDLTLHGSGPPNDLQVKFVDASGDNVWWLNRPGFVPPATPTTLRVRQRQIEFAWGPTADRTFRRAAAIEFVVAASLQGGGKGSLCLHRLALLELPAPPATPPPARVQASAGDAGGVLDGRAPWRAPAGRQQLAVDFGATRELNGALLVWQAGAAARDYDVDVSDDGRAWRTLRQVRDGDGGADAVFAPDTDARYLRVVLHRAAASAGYALQRLEFPTPRQWPSIDHAVMSLAAHAPRGTYPRAYRAEQNYWTLVGVDGGGAHAALIGEDGAIELGRGGASVEPFVVLGDGTRVSWADVRLEQSLRDGYLPLPRVRWTHDAFALDIDSAAEGTRDDARLLARYTLRNLTDREQRLTLQLAVRPFQVNPPQQMLSTQGGTSAVRELAWRDGTLQLNGRAAVRPVQLPLRVQAAAFGARAQPLATTPLRDPQALAEATLEYAVVLPPRGERRIAFTAPLAGRGAATHATDLDARFDAVAEHWRARLNRVQMKLPAPAQRLHDTLRSSLAHMLMSRVGPALQPGTRSYARTWIRDAAMMEAGLLRLGEVDAVHEFIDWFAPKIFASGKVPCCIDARGADPVVENDSHGQFVYAVAEAWRHTGDRARLERLWPRVERVMSYMESLRRSDVYGLMPKSISHEGYSDKPVHAYWDDFWALRGYKDAVQIAEALGKRAQAAEFAAWRDAFAASLAKSVRDTAQRHGIGFIAGSVELGDFDPTSTTIALNPAQAESLLPPELLRGTFERYWNEAVARRDGQRDWKDYTPYELRNVGALVRLGQRERAHALLDFFFADQRPHGWNQWAEVVARDPRQARFLGDMPHAWVSSDYIRSALDLFAYERDDGTVVVGAGLPPEWLDGDGVAIAGLSTPHGRLDYRLRRGGDGSVQLDVDAAPPAGVVFAWHGREVRVQAPGRVRLPPP
jgi:hypothetical protein